MRNRFLKFTSLLSILVGVCTFACYDQFFDEGHVDITLAADWQRLSTQDKLSRLGGLLSRDAPFSLLAEIKQFKIRRQLRKMIVRKEDEVLGEGFNYRLGFRYDLGWEELSLLGLAGFTSVWTLYVAGRIIILVIPPALMMRFPLHPLRGRTKPFNLRKKYRTASLSSDKITSVNLLVHQEERKKPGKPRAVWID